MKRIFCLDDGTAALYCENNTPYEALKKMIYTLNINHYDEKAIINKTESGKCLFTVHNGKTYAILNN